MKQVIKAPTLPTGSTVTNGFPVIHYQDTYLIKKTTEKSAGEVSKELMKLPGWVVRLFKLRNALVGVFGLKTDKQSSGQETFFTLIENREDEIIMGENDKHLNFRASIFKNTSAGTIALTTLVHFNNVWGKIYFFPVKPFHKIIMKVLLKRYAQQ